MPLSLLFDALSAILAASEYNKYRDSYIFLPGYYPDTIQIYKYLDILSPRLVVFEKFTPSTKTAMNQIVLDIIQEDPGF